MPIHAYKCTNCKVIFDHLHGLHEPDLVTCNKCKKDTLLKLLSTPSFRPYGIKP